ncbi:MAG: DUF421 domain-containing protein [Pyrinomonadaceae bacterium]
MLDWLWENFVSGIGVNEQYKSLSIAQVAFRTIVVFVIALVIIRLGKRRFMGDYGAFDILMGFIVGSIMAKAIIGDISLLNMIIVVGTLMVLHWLIATASVYWKGFGRFIEDSPRKLIVDGKIQDDALLKSKITKDDLMLALRKQASTDDPACVEVAYLERDGSITVMSKPDAKFGAVELENGEQTVTIKNKENHE